MSFSPNRAGTPPHVTLLRGTEGPSVAGPQASRTVDSGDFAASWGAAASEEEEGDCLVDCLAKYRKLDGIA